MSTSSKMSNITHKVICNHFHNAIFRKKLLLFIMIFTILEPLDFSKFNNRKKIKYTKIERTLIRKKYEKCC